MNKPTQTIFLFTLIFIWHFFYANAQWISQNSNTTEHLNCLSFVDSLHGWIVGNNGTILCTTNSGNNWLIQNAGVTTELNGVSFCDMLNGWVVGDGGTILRTNDGGNNWEKIFNDTLHYVRNYKVQCLSPSTVFILRDKFAGDYWTDERIWRTLDSGTTWDDITPIMGLNGELRDMQFLNPSLGWICGSGGFRIFTTPFQNYWSWSNSTFSVINYPLIRISFDDSLHGWIADIGKLFGTTNGGQSWDTLHKFYYNINDFCKRGQVAYKCGLGTNIIEKTTDGGSSWLVQSLPTSQNAVQISFFSSEFGWTIGWNGSICHTSNGGITEVRNDIELLPNSYQLKQNYPNPFNPSTNISFFLPTQTFSSIVIYDILGRKIATILNADLSSGWHTISWKPNNLGSGLYLYTLEVGSCVISKKMLYIK